MLDEYVGTVEPHPEGGWLIRVGTAEIVAPDGGGFPKEEAERLLDLLENHIAANN